ncbi:MAG TPA: AAA family ATPase [bacterium]|nr:AAA family ATPase [bacterium]HPN44595.1 AAA family ATPase [bacterium]
MTTFYNEPVQHIFDHLCRLNKPKYLIGIDGPGGSGKSTLAQELANALPGSVVVHHDDFYKPKYLRDAVARAGIGEYFDWQRLERQVLQPCAENREIMYQKYDWINDVLDTWQTIPGATSVIVEGVYSIRRELAGYYDLKIWLDCPADVCLVRGIIRDGEAMKEYWQNVWMKQEQEYYRQHQPQLRADIRINIYHV